MAQQPTWQGRPLDFWLRVGTQPDTVPDLDDVENELFAALAALGPGSANESKALAVLVARLDRGSAAYVGKFGKAGLDALSKHRAKIADPRELAQGVVATGELAAPIVLDRMRRADPIAREDWLFACAVASGELFAALSKRLEDADERTARDILDCMSRSSRPIPAGAETIVRWLDHPKLHDSAEAALRRCAPGGFGPLLKQLCEGKLARARANRLAEVIESAQWSPRHGSLVPLLRKCLQSNDAMGTRVAASVLAQIGPAAKPARDELLAVAKDNGIEAKTRACAFAALWNLGQPTSAELEAIASVFADRSNRGLVEQCLERLAPLGEHSVPLLHTVLDDEQLREPAIATMRLLAPDEWLKIEPTVLERARRELRDHPDTVGPFTMLLVEHSRPRGAVLELFAELYRKLPESELPDRLIDGLVTGGELRPFVDALARGEPRAFDDPRVLDAVCQRTELGPAVPWLREQLGGVEERLSKQGRVYPYCGAEPGSPHLIYARLLGAGGAAQLELLDGLRTSKNGLVRECGYVGLGQLARSSPKARASLVRVLLEQADKSWADRRNQVVLLEATAIAKALGHGGPATVRMLADELDDASPARATWLLWALFYAGAQASAAFPAIEPLLGHSDPSVAAAALAAARACATKAPVGKEAIPAALDRLANASELTPALEVTLQRMLPVAAERLLGSLPKCKPEIRYELLRALAGVQPPVPVFAGRRQFAESIMARMTQPGGDAGAKRQWLPAERFRPFLDDPSAQVRLLVLAVLQRAALDQPELSLAIADVANQDERWDVRATALFGLTGIRLTTEAETAVRRCLEDPDYCVREQARIVLETAAEVR